MGRSNKSCGGKYQSRKIFSLFPDQYFPEENFLKMDIYIYIYFFAFRWENYSSWKIIRRGKLFVGENYLLAKIFVKENYLS